MGVGGADLFEGFDLRFVETAEATIRARVGGAGPPLLLLHGHPQTHVMWHAVARRLARDFTVVAADLRGYGGSSRPAATADHEPHSKRAMARDMAEVMRRLGFGRFAVVGHDRGGRVAYRLALDHAQAVTRLAVLDIIPTGEAWRRVDMAFAMHYFHWFFLAQPAPMPERLIAADPDAFYFRSGRERFHPDALAEYLGWARQPDVIAAMVEDYRAGATYDREADDADRAAGRRIGCPVLVLWSSESDVWRRIDVLDVWRGWAGDVRGRSLDCGHYLAEELPDETYAELAAFFSDA